MLSDERLLELEFELERIKSHVIGLCEVREHREQLWKLKSSHTFYYTGDDNTLAQGTGYLIFKHRVQ